MPRDNYIPNVPEARPETITFSTNAFLAFAEVEAATKQFIWSLNRISKAVENPPVR